MIINHPILLLLALRHWATVKFYHVKWFGKINLMSLHSTGMTVITYYANPFLWILHVYTTGA